MGGRERDGGLTSPVWTNIDLEEHEYEPGQGDEEYAGLKHFNETIMVLAMGTNTSISYFETLPLRKLSKQIASYADYCERQKQKMNSKRK